MSDTPLVPGWIVETVEYVQRRHCPTETLVVDVARTWQSDFARHAGAGLPASYCPEAR